MALAGTFAAGLVAMGMTAAPPAVAGVAGVGPDTSPASSSTVLVDCPCSLWTDSTVPGTESAADANAVEVGVTFTSAVDGYITGIRFYKGASNTGPHVGHLWAADGSTLAQVTFSAETARGWQQADFASPVAVSADETYIASYHTTVGGYAVDQSYFTTPVDSGPLHAIADTDPRGHNGVYAYGATPHFPDQTYSASNYWVDVVLDATPGPDRMAPMVTPLSPRAGESSVAATANATAVFSEPMDASTVNAATVTLTTSTGAAVPASVSYDPPSRIVTVNPTTPLRTLTTYTATVRGGPTGVRDVAQIPLVTDRTWMFTSAGRLEAGAGGRVLLIGASSNPFSGYYAEILRAEGLNGFDTRAITSLTPALLSGYDAVVLGSVPVTSAQVTTLTNWVSGGGNLVAMRPSKKLAGLLGLTATAGVLPEGYVRVDTSAEPGTGIVADTMQFHGSADRYTTTSGTRTVATLYATAGTATSNPAVTLRAVGTRGGQAAAFTYDLATSVVLTRQGNPAWAGKRRDGQDGPIRADNLFFPGYVDFGKIQIPQADEQQRLFANLLTVMTRDRLPLPRFGYLPRGEDAAVVMTGDDHGSGGTAARFAKYDAQSAPGCVVDEWQCLRATSYVYPGGPLRETQAAAFEAKGFEVGLHVNTGCADYTPTSLDGFFDDQLDAFGDQYPSVSPPRTNRTHCIAWSDWAGEPTAELAHGIRLDTNYYYWPASWVQDRPGLFTGSGLPMRFAQPNGVMIDVYQATTQLTDESGQSYPATIDTLLDNATGPNGFYGAFVANIHTDNGSTEGQADAIVASATAHGVPVISAEQLLTWVDGRNASQFQHLAYTGGALRFDVVPAAGATGLQAMVPVAGPGGIVQTITADGAPVTFQHEVIKGIEYAVFAATDASYVASFA